jgi:ankyrin repeat protein
LLSLKAAKCWDSLTVKLLVENEANVFDQDEIGCNVLHFAAISDNVEVFHYLLNNIPNGIFFENQSENYLILIYKINDFKRQVFSIKQPMMVNHLCTTLQEVTLSVLLVL